MSFYFFQQFAHELLFHRYSSDRTIQKKKQEFKDPQSGRALQKLNESLSEVTNIMRQNVEDILQRGEDLACRKTDKNGRRR